MKTLVKESITLMTEVKQKLMSVKEKYPHLNNVEWEICENVIKAEKLISELEILLKILPKEHTEDKQSEQKEVKKKIDYGIPIKCGITGRTLGFM